jgi:WD40 repeat protein
MKSPQHPSVREERGEHPPVQEGEGRRPVNSRRSAALGLLLTGMLCLAGAQSAPAFTLPYTFTPVVGSPFAQGAGPFSAGVDQVVFSPHGAYLASSSHNGISIQTVSGATLGALSGGASPDMCAEPAGKPIIPGDTGSINSIAYSPNGALLAEAETPGAGGVDGSLRIYAVSGTTLRSDSCRSLGLAQDELGDYSLAFSPTGLLAVANAVKNTVSVYSVTAAGKAHPLAGSPFATGKTPAAVAFGPTGSGGEALATANSGENTVSVFSVSGGVVARAPGSPFATGKDPSSVAFSPTSGLLAVADAQANAISMFSVDLAGELTPVADSPFATGADPLSVAFSPTGGLLATADYAANDVSAFSVTAAGELAQLSSSPFSPGAGPDSIAFDADGFLLATADQSADSTAVYAYGQSPALPPRSGLNPGIGAAVSAAG